MFCRLHEQAPAARRGGWLSAFKRRAALGSSPSAPAGAADLYDCSRVAQRLWVGARPPADRSYPGIDMIVLCAAEYQPERFLAFGGRVLRCPMPDGPLTATELRRALAAGAEVAKALRAGQRVLVTCHAGINRSSFVAALALARLTRATPDQLVDLLRRTRHPQALHNPHFREYLAKFSRRR